MCDTQLNDNVTLKEVYDKVRMEIRKMRKEDPLAEIDRNPENFEAHLTATSTGDRQLTVRHLRSFLPCTSNLDPYVCKLVKEKRLEQESAIADTDTCLHQVRTAPATLVELDTEDEEQQPSITLQYLFKDLSILNNVQRTLNFLTTQDIVYLLSHLDFSEDHKKAYTDRILESNLSGLVLGVCELDLVREELKMTLGDWTLFRLLIELLRENGHLLSTSPSPIREQRSRVASINHSISPAQSLRKMSATRSRSSKSLTIPSSTPTNIKPTNNDGEVESHQRWLIEQFGRMDTVEFLGDIVGSGGSVSRPSSVKFEDEVVIPMENVETPSEPNSLLAGLPNDVEKLTEDKDNVDEDETTSADSTESVFGSTEELRPDVTEELDSNKLYDMASKLRTSTPAIMPHVTDDDLIDLNPTTRPKSASVRGSRSLHSKLVRQYTADSSRVEDEESTKSLLFESDRKGSSASVSEDEHQLTIIKRPTSSDERSVPSQDSQRPVLFQLWRKDSSSSKKSTATDVV